jgi:hypothetical protein
VLTVWGWTAEILEQWFTEVRPAITSDGDPAAWPSERGARVGVKHLNKRLSEYRDELGLDPVLDFHSLRRAYVTHLIEAAQGLFATELVPLLRTAASTCPRPRSTGWSPAPRNGCRCTCWPRCVTSLTSTRPS